MWIEGVGDGMRIKLYSMGLVIMRIPYPSQSGNFSNHKAAPVLLIQMPLKSLKITISHGMFLRG